MLDVYICHQHDGGCGDEFAVKEAREPRCCPFCGSQVIEFSHVIIEEEII